MSVYIDCPICGHQVIMQEYGEKCYWCGNPISIGQKAEIGTKKAHYNQNLPPLKAEAIQCIKEETKMAEKNTPVPSKPKGYKQLAKYWEDNKEAILSDYRAMAPLKFMRRWGMSANTWQNLKLAWGVQNNRQAKAKAENRARTEAGATSVGEAVIKEHVDVSLSEHDRYLFLLGYQQATREFLKALNIFLE